ncbi:hypothetical protein PFICI_13792 [Pestalotiopsis fici W106-1]|uniref:RRM domain-containing protein n=1 Tax=Pestalotiopsis fici (strain W106-1 / CGMCC3.15140) TaxID=1229662 RepID=W3WM86_PESFW|nr:uncharacterized protein PFICI_13792 [Pestalotiopsis fici W106-1]ETS73926.1 hypothetical protein PFICI_13792 [Pestalotiopsis fici W106-1]
MNQIRQIQTLNKRELEAGIYDPAASWHADYRDTAFVNFGGLPYNLSEGDVLTIFSQFGEPVFLKLARDKETGKSKGFGWLKYEDQRSCDLAVDNLGGAEIAGRLIRVDHARYKSRDDEDDSEFRVGWEDLKKKERQDHGEKSESESEEEQEVVRRPLIQEEKELAKLIAEHDEDDPMKAFLVEEKKKEVEEALQRAEKKERKHKHRHHHRTHRSHRSGEGEDDREKRRSKRDATPLAEDRRRDGTPDARDRDRDRRNRDHGRDGERHRDRRRRDDHEDSERRRDRDGRRDRDAEGDGQRHRHRTRDYDQDRRSHRRSRSRSPRGHENK